MKSAARKTRGRGNDAAGFPAGPWAHLEKSRSFSGEKGRVLLVTKLPSVSAKRRNSVAALALATRALSPRKIGARSPFAKPYRQLDSGRGRNYVGAGFSAACVSCPRPSLPRRPCVSAQPRPRTLYPLALRSCALAPEGSDRLCDCNSTDIDRARSSGMTLEKSLIASW